MKGAAMKIGQLASFIDTDFLPEEYRELYQEKLAHLRSEAPAMPWKKVAKVLEEEWEEPPEELFEDFEHEAAAAASIGQVHRATLPDGRRVAVKIQYPGVAKALRADMQTRLSRSRVLVSEWVDGMGFEEVKELPQSERDRFGEIVFRFCFGSIYHLRHFNADAHPGNYVWMDDGRVAFLDFGMTKQLDQEQIELEVVAIQAVLDDNPEALRAALAD